MKTEREPPCTAVVCVVVLLAYWSLFTCVCVERRFNTASSCYSTSSALGILVQYNLRKEKKKKSQKKQRKANESKISNLMSTFFFFLIPSFVPSRGSAQLSIHQTQRSWATKSSNSFEINHLQQK